MTDDPTAIPPEDEEVISDDDEIVEGKTDAPSEAKPLPEGDGE